MKVSDEKFPLRPPSDFIFRERPVSGSIVHRREFYLTDWIRKQWPNWDLQKVQAFYERRKASEYEAFILYDATGVGIPVHFSMALFSYNDVKTLRPALFVTELHIMAVQIERDFLEQKYKRLEDAVVSARFATVSPFGNTHYVTMPKRLYSAMCGLTNDAYHEAKRRDEGIHQ